MKSSLRRAWKGFRSVRDRAEEPQTVFATYAEASEACLPAGYEDDDLVATVVEKTLQAKNELKESCRLGKDALGILHGIAALLPSSSLRVLDFGGGAGHHYFSVRAVVGDAVDIRWNVVETPKMVAAASKTLADSSLRFFTAIEEAATDLGHVQLVLSSSSLPYTPDPFGYLSKLLGVKADHLFITRTPLTDVDETFTIIQKSRLAHNGPGPLPPEFVDREVQYPLTLVNKHAFESRIQELYSVRFSIDEAVGVPHSNGTRLDLYGVFGDLRS